MPHYSSSSLTREELHRTFGGYIYAHDYDRIPSHKKKGVPSETASRIISDWNFDYLCKLNLIQREMKERTQE